MRYTGKVYRRTISGRERYGVRFVQIVAEVHTPADSERLGYSPHWSICGEVWHAKADGSRDRRYGDMIAGGQIVEDMARAFPKLAPVLAVHLCDADGTSMHAVANARYFYAQGETDNAAAALHVDPSELPALLEQTAGADDQFTAIGEILAPRWLAAVELAAAIIAPQAQEV